MRIQLKDINVRAELPGIPPVLPVYLVHTASLEERQPAIRRLRDLLNLNDLVTVDDVDSLRYESPSGEIQFYRPSGSIWIEDARANEAYPDERRPWEVTRVADDNDPGNFKLVLNQADEEKLAQQTEELLRDSGLWSSNASFAGVSLDQVAQLNTQGKEVGCFAGEANIRFLYSLDGFEVDGPGAKSYAFYSPGMHRHTFTGLYHAWREVEDRREIKMHRIDEILEDCLVRDEELQICHQRGDSIAIQHVDLVYLALGPDVHQDYVFPTLRVDGHVVFEASSPELEGFEFSRFYHAARPQEYAAAKVYAHYLVELPE